MNDRNELLRYMDLQGGRRYMAEAEDDPTAHRHARPGDIVVLNRGDGHITRTSVGTRAELAVVLAVPPATATGVLYATADRKFGYGRCGFMDLPGGWSCLTRVEYVPTRERIRLIVREADDDGAEIAAAVFAAAIRPRPARAPSDSAAVPSRPGRCGRRTTRPRGGSCASAT